MRVARCFLVGALLFQWHSPFILFHFSHLGQLCLACQWVPLEVAGQLFSQQTGRAILLVQGQCPYLQDGAWRTGCLELTIAALVSVSTLPAASSSIPWSLLPPPSSFLSCLSDLSSRHSPVTRLCFLPLPATCSFNFVLQHCLLVCRCLGTVHPQSSSRHHCLRVAIHLSRISLGLTMLQVSFILSIPLSTKPLLGPLQLIDHLFFEPFYLALRNHLLGYFLALANMLVLHLLPWNASVNPSLDVAADYTISVTVTLLLSNHHLCQFITSLCFSALLPHVLSTTLGVSAGSGVPLFIDHDTHWLFLFGFSCVCHLCMTLPSLCSQVQYCQPLFMLVYLVLSLCLTNGPLFMLIYLVFSLCLKKRLRWPHNERILLLMALFRQLVLMLGSVLLHILLVSHHLLCCRTHSWSSPHLKSLPLLFQCILSTLSLQRKLCPTTLLCSMVLLLHCRHPKTLIALLQDMHFLLLHSNIFIAFVLVTMWQNCFRVMLPPASSDVIPFYTQHLQPRTHSPASCQLSLCLPRLPIFQQWQITEWSLPLRYCRGIWERRLLSAHAFIPTFLFQASPVIAKSILDRRTARTLEI